MKVDLPEFLIEDVRKRVEHARSLYENELFHKLSSEHGLDPRYETKFKTLQVLGLTKHFELEAVYDLWGKRENNNIKIFGGVFRGYKYAGIRAFFRQVNAEFGRKVPDGQLIGFLHTHPSGLDFSGLDNETLYYLSNGEKDFISILYCESLRAFKAINGKLENVEINWYKEEE